MPLPKDNPTPTLSPEQIAAAQQFRRPPMTHERRVETLLGWILAATGVVALGVIVSAISALAN